MTQRNKVLTVFDAVDLALTKESMRLTPLERALLRSWWGLDRSLNADVSDAVSRAGMRDAVATTVLKLEYYIAGVAIGRFPNPLHRTALPRISAAV